MASNAHTKLKDWRKDAKKTLEEAGEAVGVTATAWFEWERDDIPALHTALDLEKLTDRAVTVGDWALLSKAKARARAVARTKRRRALSASKPPAS